MKELILLTEDESIIAMDIQHILEKWGFEVGVASNGYDAVTYAKEKLPSLIIMDIILEGDMDGIKTAEEIKSFYDVPIIFLNAIFNEDIFNRAISIDPYGYLIKPVNENDLYVMIKIALNKHTFYKPLKEHKRYKDLINQISDGVFIIDRLGDFLIVNNIAAKLLFYEPEELMKMNIKDINLDNNLVNSLTYPNEICNEKIVVKEQQFTRKNGTIITIQLKASLLDNNLIQIVFNDLAHNSKINDIMDVQRELGIALSSAIDMKETLAQVVDMAVKINSIDSGSILLYDNSDGSFNCGYAKGFSNEFLKFIAHYNKNSEIVKLIMKKKAIYTTYEDMIVNKLGYSMNDVIKKEGLKSVSIIPIVYRDEVIACMNMNSHSLNEIPSNSMEILEYIASLVGSVIVRLKAEEALHVSEMRYRRIIESITDYIYTVRVKEGNVIETIHGPACVTVTGYTAEEFKSNPYLWIGMVHEDDKKAVQELAKNSLLHTDVTPLEHRIIHKNGTIRWVRNTTVQYYDSNGTLISYDGIIRDITERKIAEEALKNSMMTLATAQATAHLGSWDWDIHTGEVIWSDETFRLFGWQPHEINVTFDILKERIFPEDREIFLKEIKDALDDVKPFNNKHRIVQLDGTIRTHHSQSTVFRDSQGKPLKMIGTVLDITESKKAEETLKASLSEKEILLKEVHHRVKNNLQIILSLLNLQARDLKNNEVLELLNVSQNRIRSMALIHEKLYRSDDLAHIDLDEYIKTISHELQQTYTLSNRKILFKFNTSRIMIGLDYAIPCGLIINELISNAIKHAFPPDWTGKCQITISLYELPDNIIELSVCDSGIGLSNNINFRTTETLGMQLIVILAENQLKGELKVRKENGTKITIKFKKI